MINKKHETLTKPIPNKGFTYSLKGCYPQQARRPKLRIGRRPRIEQKLLHLWSGRLGGVTGKLTFLPTPYWA